MIKEEINKIWEEYKKFCKYACETQDVKSNCAADFLGWLALEQEDMDINDPRYEKINRSRIKPANTDSDINFMHSNEE